MLYVMLSVAALMGAAMGIPCDDAQMKCAYRGGCGKALQNYLLYCAAVMQEPPPTYCPESCQHSLIALTSTEEGKALMNCECRDSYCEDQKLRAEICRMTVMKSINETIVSCRVAQSICSADTQCFAALGYYNRLCRSMFRGKKCTARCNNSISILRRQEKADRLKTCRCDGREDYDCHSIQHNMEKLCFHKHRSKDATTSEQPPDEQPPPPPAPPVVYDTSSSSPTLHRPIHPNIYVLITFAMIWR